MPHAMTASLEIPDCPMCGESERDVAYELAPFGVARCARCHFHYLSPRVPEATMLDAYRSGEYFESPDVGYESYADQERALRATFRRLLRRAARSGYVGGDLLEVGAGYGYLLEEAGSYFDTVTGTEFSSDAANAARSRGLDVLVGGLDVIQGRQFDLVIAAHVIEHVYAPRDFIGELVERVRPGGQLLIGTPDMGSWWRRVLGARWPSFKLPEHVLYFDEPHLRDLMAGAGLEEIRPVPYLHYFPVSLILSKVGVRSVGRRLRGLGSTPVAIPATTIALAGRRLPAT